MTEQCDIVIPVWNQLEITKNCFESLRKFTNYPYRLIVIDNGSDKPTSEYLKKCSDFFPSYKLIKFEKNMGFVKAVNSGLSEATAEFICLLNNDTLVTPGWLAEMIAVMYDEKIGVLNPSSNSWGQLPTDGDIQNYAKSLSPLKGKWQETGYCIGFCMMIRKSSLQEVGYLDEAYGVGYLEETDFCRRLQSRGYLCAKAKAAYVFHLGGESFKKILNSRSMYENNLKLFNKKWGKSLRIAVILGGIPVEEDIIKINKMVLSACRDSHAVAVYLRGAIHSAIFNDHASLRIYNLKNNLFNLMVCLHILSRQLKKKKGKDYNLVVVRNSYFYYLIKVLGKLFGFMVICNFDIAYAQDIWHKISRKLGSC